MTALAEQGMRGARRLALSRWLAVEPLDLDRLPLTGDERRRLRRSAARTGATHRIFNSLRRALEPDDARLPAAALLLTERLRTALDRALVSGEASASLPAASGLSLRSLQRCGIVTADPDGEEERFFQALERRRPAVPPLALVEITTRCKMTCAFCGHGLMSRARTDLDRDAFRCALDRLAESGQKSVALYGYGEPLLHPDLPAFVRLAAGRGLKVWLSTVPVDLTPALGKALLDAGLHGMCLSIDSLRPEAFRRVRGRAADLDRAVANASAFLAANRRRRRPVMTVVRMVSLAGVGSDGEEEHGFVRFWSRRGADVAYVRPHVAAVPDAAATAGEHRAARLCTWPWTRAVALRGGEVTACCLDYDARLAMGSWKDGSLAAIWGGPAYARLRQALRTDTLPPGHACATCPVAFPAWRRRLDEQRARARSVRELPVVVWET